MRLRFLFLRCVPLSDTPTRADSGVVCGGDYLMLGQCLSTLCSRIRSGVGDDAVGMEVERGGSRGARRLGGGGAFHPTECRFLPDSAPKTKKIADFLKI